MSKKSKKSKVKTYSEIFQSTRKGWGNVNPVTKVEEDKRRKKPKYPHKDEE